MSEFEFDKYVKSLLHDAEEEVSPRVWEGITAVLTRKRRRALAWRMGAVSLTAAAAVAVFIVNHSNPSISTVVTPSATALVMEETSRPVLQTEAQPSFTEAVVETRGTAVHRKAQAIPAAPVAALVQHLLIDVHLDLEGQTADSPGFNDLLSPSQIFHEHLIRANPLDHLLRLYKVRLEGAVSLEHFRVFQRKAFERPLSLKGRIDIAPN